MPPAPQPTSSEPGPAEPRDTDAKYQLRKTIADRLFPHRWSAKVEAAEALFKLDHNNWSANIAEWRRRIAQWEAERAEFDADQARYNHAIDRDRDLYMNREPDAIVDYCQKVLWRSKYPEFFPRDYDVDYVAATRTLIVDYVLPSPRDIPQIRQVKYVQSHDQLVDVNLNDSEFAVLYDNILYQVSLRTIHELYEADVIDAIASIAFNGYVDSLDPRTGHAVRPCVLSLTTRRDEFMDVNLHNVDPKACFKKLKGVAASQLHSLTAVAPIMQMNRQDRRFVAPKAVAHAVDAGNNLAAMHWEDFEHLIRELFEKEFSQDGGEVRITQASRDQGVDAIAFNPDPIRGGKIVIQAKRYTNTVGVSAVRDLYGTVMNEGATKGILVTTADYGPDAYEFARDKPLTLMNGSNLLHLLETHGHRARIDLIEAKQQLAAEERTRR
jgi:restriction system protein